MELEIEKETEKGKEYENCLLSNDATHNVMDMPKKLTTTGRMKAVSGYI